MRPWDKSEYTEYNDLMRKAKQLELESQLKELKAIQLDNLKREPNHPRNKFDYAIIVPNHPLGYHEHYCMDLEVAKQSAREWSADYGRVSVEDKNLNTVYAIF